MHYFAKGMQYKYTELGQRSAQSGVKTALYLKVVEVFRDIKKANNSLISHAVN